MHPASLPGCTDQDGLDRAAQPGVGVGDNQLHPGQSAGLQRPQKRRPEGAVLGVADVKTERFAAYVGGHAGGDHYRLRDDPVVDPGLAVGGVEEHVGEWLFGQRPFAKRSHLGVQIGAVPRALSSALLPMGGAVSGVAGPNWMLVGDAAACVNPLNGEGIDYGLESGRLATELLGSGDVSHAWPYLLQHHYASAFSIARRLSWLGTVPWLLATGGPIAVRSARLMEIVMRVMNNMVTDDDADLMARIWRCTGTASRRVDRRPPFSRNRIPMALEDGVRRMVRGLA